MLPFNAFHIQKGNKAQTKEHRKLEIFISGKNNLRANNDTK